MLFGKKWYELGLTSKHRNLNRTIKEFRVWVGKLLEAKSIEFDKKWESGEF